jgi:hypothetical protein
VQQKRTASVLIGVGALLCIPAALVLTSYVASVIDADALDAAPICATPTRDGGANCLSEFAGAITAVTPHSKSLDHVTLVVGGASYDLGYDCAESPAGACAAVSFKPGAAITAGWWRGQLVAFGAAESRPSVVTELHPFDQLRAKSGLLGFVVVPAVSFLAGGLLLRQAPMSVDDLVRSALTEWPEPPRPVDRRLIWRVALGYWAPYGLFAWFFVGVIVTIPLLGFAQYRLALPSLALTFAVTFAAAAWVSARYLGEIVRTSDRRSLTVRGIKAGVGKGGAIIQVSYDLPNGKTATRLLGVDWKGRVKTGDLLDALTDPKSGSIRRLLSKPPAQA